MKTSHEINRSNGGNGKSYVSQDILAREKTPKQWWEVDARRVAKTIASIILFVASLLAVWYQIVARVEAHDTAISRLATDVQKIEAKTKTKEGAEGDMRVVAESLKRIDERLNQIDRRVERVEMRQIGVSVADPERE